MAPNFTPLDPPAPPFHKESEPVGGGLNLDVGEMRQSIEQKSRNESTEPFIAEKNEDIAIPSDLKKAGLQAVRNDDFPSFSSIKTPLSDDKAFLGQRAPITSPLRWLSALTLYILAQAHLTLKIVHGHAVRILRR